LSNGKRRNAAIQKISNHPNAILLGSIYNVQDYFDEVCCLVSPFMVPHFSRPVIEAHLHKKPAIGSDVEGMDEIIEHEKNGLIVPKNNPKALAAAINALTANSQKAKRFGKEGYNIAIHKFTPRNIQQFERLYDQLMYEN
jgi:glycosyltransferase involved in cell wall biosynthesis